MPESKRNPLACWLVAEWRCGTIDVRVISFHPVRNFDDVRFEGKREQNLLFQLVKLDTRVDHRLPVSSPPISR